MTQDLLFKPDQNEIYDLQIDGKDLSLSEGFENAIAVSLFTDARADASLQSEATRRRGWIGNVLSDVQGYQLGGLLWILDQSKLTQDTLNFARIEAEASLRWMIDDGIAQSIQVDVEQLDSIGIIIFVTIFAAKNQIFKYQFLWQNTDLSKVV